MEMIDGCQSLLFLLSLIHREKVAGDSEQQKPAVITSKVKDIPADIDAFIRNVWESISDMNYGRAPQYDYEPTLKILKLALQLLREEPTVLELSGPVMIFGDLYGHGDSLLTLLSLQPPSKMQQFLFLGNYIGGGYAPHEVLFFLLALKVRYPKKIFLLRGNMEDPGVAKGYGFIEGLEARHLMTNIRVWLACEQIFELLPVAAVVNGKFFCVHGGIGPKLMERGIKGLRAIQRPVLMPAERTLVKEAIWSCIQFKQNDTISDDDVPLFSEEDARSFCETNSVQMIIRSRQLVMRGVLNFPECVLTIWSAVSYLDSFTNMAAALAIDAEGKTATVLRYYMYEAEPKSLDDVKPLCGRNAPLRTLQNLLFSRIDAMPLFFDTYIILQAFFELAKFSDRFCEHIPALEDCYHGIDALKKHSSLRCLCRA